MKTLILVDKEELSELFEQQLQHFAAMLQQDSIKKSSEAAAVPTDLLTRKETALYLKISLPTVDAWTKQGVIKCIRIQSRVYYSRAALSRFSA